MSVPRLLIYENLNLGKFVIKLRSRPRYVKYLSNLRGSKRQQSVFLTTVT